MTDPTRARINAAFDDELAATPVPPGLRALSVRAATTASRQPSGQPLWRALVAGVLVVALVATVAIGSRALRSVPAPVRSRPAASAYPPQPRAGAGLVYDAAHNELVLFGGSANYGVVNETWTWDGSVWRLYRPAVAPARRLVGAMAYDEMHGDVVLFGGMASLATSGKGGQTPVDDTWTWNGSTWKEQHPLHEPVLSYDWPPVMAYDQGSRTVLLFGFKQTSGETVSMIAQTWSWNGSDWRQLTPTTTPIGVGQLTSDGGRLYYLAPAAGRVGGRYVTQVWRWDGTTWTLLDPSNDLGVLLGGSAAFDVERRTVVAFDGDTWTWDGSRWLRQHPTTRPPATGYMAYFAALHEVVMWGDLSGQWSNGMWAWNGANWSLAAAGTAQPLPSPPDQFGPLTPQAAALLIRQTVKNSSPVLLPALVLAGMEADGMATADDFDVAYQSDQRDRSVSIGMVAANPPPGDAQSSDTLVKFRHALAMKYRAPGYAEYFVYDPAAPRSDRWLMWLEPGTMSVQGSKSQGVWYFMSASGLTDAEFWQVANSLR